MTYKEKYNDLRERLKFYFEAYYNHPTPANKAEWKYAEQEFSNFCVLALERLVSDGLQVLDKMEWED